MSANKTPLAPSGFIAGFLLLMLLPAVIAFFDVSVGQFIPYETRMMIWSQPWAYVSSITVFFSWVSARRVGNTFVTLSAFDTAAIGFLLVLSIWLSRWVAENPDTADLHLLRVGLALMLGVSAYYGMKTYQSRFSQPIYRALLVGALGVALATLVFVYFQPLSRELGSSIAWFLPGFGPVRVFGIFYEVAILICVGLIVAARSWSTLVMLGIVLVVLWTALFWSGGRGALLSLFLSVGLASLFFRRSAAKLWLVFLASAFTGALLSLPLFVPEGSSFGLMNLLKAASREGANAISAGRIERWVAAIDLIRAHPYFGYGLNQFSNLWTGFSLRDEAAGLSTPVSIYFLSYRHVHNIVFEAFLSWGVIGGSLFFVLLFKTWIKAAKRALSAMPDEKLPAFMALNALLFHSNFTGIYIYPHSLLYIAIFFGICLVPNPAQNENTKG